MTRRLHSLALIGAIAAAGARLAAQTPTKPSVTVVAFTPERRAKLSARDGAAIADELSRQLVEGGRYRVLQREWLPAVRGKTPSIDEVRRAAAAAGVAYVVIGTVGETRAPRPRYAPARGTILHPSMPGARGLRPTVVSHPPLALAGPIRPPAAERMVTMRVQIIDVASGRTADSRDIERPRGRPGGGVAVLGAIVGGRVGAAMTTAALARHAAASRVDGLDQGVRDAIAEVASAMAAAADRLTAADYERNPS